MNNKTYSVLSGSSGHASFSAVVVGRRVGERVGGVGEFVILLGVASTLATSMQIDTSTIITAINSDWLFFMSARYYYCCLCRS
jgi:hypothetical protein